MGLTKIEWTSFLRPNGTFMPGYTGNLWWGCTEVHSGCHNCYARVLSHRWGQELWGNKSPRRATKSFFTDMDKYQKLAAKDNEVHRVFVGSMMDIFEKPMPTINSKGETLLTDTGYLRDIFFKNISDGRYPNLMFLLLTKRPSNINKYIPESWKLTAPDNVIFGTSPVNQETFDNLWLHLARIKGKRFLSVEPMLDEIILKSYCPSCDKLLLGSMSTTCGTCNTQTIKPDWIICGGESGHNKRPFNAEWARYLRNQCAAYDVPFFMKQMDKVQPIPDDLIIRQFYK